MLQVVEKYTSLSQKPGSASGSASGSAPGSKPGVATESGSVDGLPILHSVVRCGNASIIKSHRLGQQVLDELEALRVVPRELQKAIPAIAELEANDRLSPLDDLFDRFDETIDFEQPDLALGDDASFSLRDFEATISDDELEVMVETLVERHVDQLKGEIRNLLTKVRQPR